MENLAIMGPEPAVSWMMNADQVWMLMLYRRFRRIGVIRNGERVGSVNLGDLGGLQKGDFRYRRMIGEYVRLPTIVV